MPTESTPSSSDPALATYDSPIGSLTLAARGGALIGLWGAGQRFFGSPYGIDEAGGGSAQELNSAGSRDDIPTQGGGGGGGAGGQGGGKVWFGGKFGGEGPTPAPLRAGPGGRAHSEVVWGAMDAIPYGATHTYGHLAATLRGAGVPASAQAIGGAVGRNPLLLIRPCHRVVAATSLGGYAAGSGAKAWLLAHEEATASSAN